MKTLAIFLALNGAAVLVVSIIGGLVLWRSIVGRSNKADWHLLHAGVSARGIMLMALAGVIHLPALPQAQLWAAASLIVVFVWTSTVAMIIRAFTRERGFDLARPPANQITFLLYGVGTAAVFPGFAWLMIGLVRAL